MYTANAREYILEELYVYIEGKIQTVLAILI